jgi:hypothetical protein
MADNSKDVRILRELAKEYAELAAKPLQEERRELWSAHFSLKETRTLGSFLPRTRALVAFADLPRLGG